MPSSSRLLLLAAAAILLSAATAAPAAAKRKGKVVGGPSDAPRPDDIPYIKCQVCQLLAKNAWIQVREMRKAATPSKPLDENSIIEKMEKITTAWRPEGQWITRLDLVEEGDKLVVKEMDQAGNCGSECKTIQLAAQHVMGEHDTDVAEVLFLNKMHRLEFNKWLCWDNSEACLTEPPPLPKDRKPGPPFDPKKEGDQSLDAMLGGLEDTPGLGNSKKLRDELMEKLGMKQEEVDEDDDSPEAVLKRVMAQLDAEGASAQPSGGQAGWEEL